MQRSLVLTTFLILAVCIASIACAETPTLIESADGKRLLQLSGNQIRNEPDEKLLLTISGNDILVDAHAPATLVVDGNDVRPGGSQIILARFDGDDLRHGKDVEAKVLMNYHHPDLCPTAHDNRMYVVNGKELSKQQLVAVLYALKPQLFKLSDAEAAAQKKAMAEAGAEADRLAAEDQVAKTWMVLNGHGPIDKISQGSIIFSPKKNDAYPVTFDYTKGGGPAFTGVAVSKVVNGDQLIWAAYGTPKTIGLCVYKIDGGKLTGEWHPWYDQGDPKNIGTEELKGPDKLDGDYEIVSAKAPATGAVYKGTVTIKPLAITGATEDEKPYSITWTIGGAKIQGIAIRTGDCLFASSGGGSDINIARFKLQNGSFAGNFYKLGSTEQGGLAATN